MKCTVRIVLQNDGKTGQRKPVFGKETSRDKFITAVKQGLLFPAAMLLLALVVISEKF